MYSFDHQAVADLAKNLKTFLSDIETTTKIISLEKDLAVSWEIEKSFKSESHSGRLSICRIGQKKILLLDEFALWCELMNLHQLCVFYLALESLGFEDFIFISSAGAWNEDLKVTDCILATDIVNLSSVDPFMGENLSFLKVKERREIFSQSLLSEFLNSESTGLNISLGTVCFWEKSLLPSPAENSLFRPYAQCYTQSFLLESLLLHGLGKRVINFVIISHFCSNYHANTLSSEEDATNFVMHKLCLNLNDF